MIIIIVRKRNLLFRSTEAAKPAAQPKELKRNAPVSVYLSNEMRDKIDERCQWSGQSHYAVLQAAVRRMLRDWDNGIPPELKISKKLK